MITLNNKLINTLFRIIFTLLMFIGMFRLFNLNAFLGYLLFTIGYIGTYKERYFEIVEEYKTKHNISKNMILKIVDLVGIWLVWIVCLTIGWGKGYYKLW